MDRRSAVRFAPSEIARMEKLAADGEVQVLDCNFCQKLAEKFNRSAGRAGSRALQAAQVQGWFLNKFPQSTNKPPCLHTAPEEKASEEKASEEKASEEKALDSEVTVSVSEEKASASEVNVSVSGDKAAASEERLLPLDTSVLNNGDVVSLNSPKESKDKVPEVDELEFEAKSSKDSAWYDIATFLAHRKNRAGEVEVRVRFEGFGAEEDEWVNVKKCIRQRSIPLESSQCRSISEGDLVLCFWEGNEEALHLDAHVVEIERKQHDIRGCRCVFLVEYDHDSSQERVNLKKLSRRPKYS